MAGAWSAENWLCNLLEKWPLEKREITVPRDSDAGDWLSRQGYRPSKQHRAIVLTRTKAHFLLKLAAQQQNAAP